jgi:arylsulfatase B
MDVRRDRPRHTQIVAMLVKSLAILCLEFGVLSASWAASQQNVLLIIADDFGTDSCSLYNSTNTGASLPPTPNMESLARSGVVFRNAYANPLCSPSRCCILTGRHAFRTGVGDVITGVSDATLMPGEFTLPDAFAANSGLGYAYAQFGKWHLHNGPNSPRTVGGWQYFAGSIPGEIANYTNWTKNVNGVSTANYTNYATTDVVDDALAWIQARGAQPWFAWVAFNAPHTPLHKPPNHLHSYDSLPGTQSDINARPRPYFEAMVESMDGEIGRLLSGINRTNTHVIFLGDNGTDTRVIQPPFSANHGKGTLYQGGTRVPLVVSGPAVANPGSTNDMPAHVVDLYATILDMAGINVPATLPATIKIDSHSLMPALQGATEAGRRVYTELFNTNESSAADGRSLRNLQFKLIEFENGTKRFHDLATDPDEQTNLLSFGLNAAQLANYYSLTLALGAYQNNPATITGYSLTGGRFNVIAQREADAICTLWQASGLDELSWSPVTNAVVVTNQATTVTLTDTNAIGGARFYQVLGTKP